MLYGRKKKGYPSRIHMDQVEGLNETIADIHGIHSVSRTIDLHLERPTSPTKFFTIAVPRQDMMERIRSGRFNLQVYFKPDSGSDTIFINVNIRSVVMHQNNTVSFNIAERINDGKLYVTLIS